MIRHEVGFWSDRGLSSEARPIEAARLVDGVFVIEEAACGLTLWTLTPAGEGVVLAEGVEVSV